MIWQGRWKHSKASLKNLWSRPQRFDLLIFCFVDLGFLCIVPSRPWRNKPWHWRSWRTTACIKKFCLGDRAQQLFVQLLSRLVPSSFTTSCVMQDSMQLKWSRDDREAAFQRPMSRSCAVVFYLKLQQAQFCFSSTSRLGSIAVACADAGWYRATFALRRLGRCVYCWVAGSGLSVPFCPAREALLSVLNDRPPGGKRRSCDVSAVALSAQANSPQDSLSESTATSAQRAAHDMCGSQSQVQTEPAARRRWLPGVEGASFLDRWTWELESTRAKPCCGLQSSSRPLCSQLVSGIPSK